jgi:hypothetical protein
MTSIRRDRFQRQPEKLRNYTTNAGFAVVGKIACLRQLLPTLDCLFLKNNWK